MKITWTIVDTKHIPSDLPLVVFVWEEKGKGGQRDERGPKVTAALPATLPKETRAAVAQALGNREVSSRLGSCELFYAASVSGSPRRLVLAGCGSLSAVDRTTIARALGAAACFLKAKHLSRAAFFLPGAFLTVAKGAEPLGVLVAKAVALSTYTFTRYQSKKEDEGELQEIVVVRERSASAAIFRRGLVQGDVIAAATNLARDWTNMPANDATPMFLAGAAQQVGREFRTVRATVLDKERIKKEGMGGIWGVSRGSREHPAFIILEYFGAEKTRMPLVLVGKTVTFDSGGISIKPAEKMEEMKYDMAGGAAVIAALRAIAELKLPVNVVALAPATENLPGGEAYKPGDILKTLSGKTIEVLNTDAEGRVILSDALEYAKRYTPALCVDIATLTGAVSAALGNSVTALLGNDPEAIRRVKQAARASNESVWELPLLEEYKEYVKSDVADLKNITGRQGGVISGAAFLEAFARPMTWAHLDVGGTAYTTEAKPWMAKGATGWGVHLFVELAKQFAKRKS